MIVFVNGERRELEGPVTVDQVLGLSGRAPRGYAVAVDGEVVPRTRHQTTHLDDGAHVEIVTAVQGG